ncbi:hypothetical protein, partial [Parabacteroides sp.]
FSFLWIYSVIGASDYVISISDYIIASTDFIITGTDYRIYPEKTKNLQASEQFSNRAFRFYLNMQLRHTAQGTLVSYQEIM